jgi:hypothetical protein
MRNLVLVGIALAGCRGPHPQQRCNGNAVERYDTSDHSSTPRWRETLDCGAALVCVETETELAYPDERVDWAVCASPAGPDPLCDGLTGMRCLDDGHIASCLSGYRISPANFTRDERCPTAQPHCAEPEPGFAFCTDDPQPNNSLCAGIASRPMRTCVRDPYGCTETAFQQACLDTQTSVKCLHDVLIEVVECSNDDHCYETDGIVQPCTNLPDL